LSFSVWQTLAFAKGSLVKPKLSIVFVAIATAPFFFPSPAMAVIFFPDPAGGWLYQYSGAFGAAGTPYSAVNPVGATNNLDGTWDNRNGSDEWAGDGRGAGNGAGGGISSDGSILTIEDAVNATSGTGNNRKIYLSHSLAQEGLVDNSFMTNGVTISFAARLTPAEDPLNEAPAKPDGFGIFSEGKGHFGVHEVTGDSLISFSLVRATEETNNAGATFSFPSAGLAINGRNTTNDMPGTNVDIVDGSNIVRNYVPFDPTEFHELWITIVGNGQGPTAADGTHTVTVYLDGSPTPVGTFFVTGGTGADGSGGNDPTNLKQVNGLFMGSNNSSTTTSLDVFHYSVKPGVHAPIPEPGTFGLALLAAGLGGVGYAVRRIRR
jgi:hypothetical protein